MRIIKKQLWLSCFSAVAAVSLTLLFLVLKTYLLAGIAGGAFAVGIIFLLRIIQKQGFAMLILENRLLGICPATVSRTDGEDSSARRVSDCVFSPFGLLLDGRVYRFGQGGINLHSINIGGGRITVEFGNEEKCWSAALLHKPLTEDEIARLADKLTYETGIVPSLHD